MSKLSSKLSGSITLLSLLSGQVHSLVGFKGNLATWHHHHHHHHQSRCRRSIPISLRFFASNDANNDDDDDNDDGGRAEVFDLEEDAAELVDGAAAIRSTHIAAEAAAASRFGGLLIRIDDLSWVAASVRLESFGAGSSQALRRCAISNLRNAADMAPNLPSGLEYVFIGGIAKNAKRVLGFAARNNLAVVLRSLDDATLLERSIVEAGVRGSKKAEERDASMSRMAKRKGKGRGSSTAQPDLEVFLTGELLAAEDTVAHLAENCPHLALRGCWFDSVSEAMRTLQGGAFSAAGLLPPGSNKLDLVLPAIGIGGEIGELLAEVDRSGAAAAVGTISFVA